MKKKEQWTGILLAAPVIIGTFIFFLLPFLLTIKMSFFEKTGIYGIGNYKEVLSSSAFQLATVNTVKFILIVVPVILVSAFVLALIFRYIGNRGSFLRSTMLFPMIIPVGAFVIIIQYFFGKLGIINQVLEHFSYKSVDWMESKWAFVLLICIYIYKYLGYNSILILAGFNMIPKEQEEYAFLEGAKKRDIVRFIYLPQLIPVLFFTCVISIVNSFKIYREAFLIGGAHPNRNIYFLQHFLNNNFENLNYQRLSVAAILVFFLIFFVTALMYKAQKKYEDLV